MRTAEVYGELPVASLGTQEPGPVLRALHPKPMPPSVTLSPTLHLPCCGFGTYTNRIVSEDRFDAPYKDSGHLRKSGIWGCKPGQF